MLKKIIFIFFLISLGSICFGEEIRHVVFLSSYNLNRPDVSRIYDAFETIIKLSEKPVYPVPISLNADKGCKSHIYVDTGDAYLNLIKSYSPAFIVAVGNEAAEFCLRCNDDHFSHIPVLFVNVSKMVYSSDDLPENIRFIPSDVCVKHQLKLAERVNPDLGKVYVITDNKTKTGNGYREEFFCKLNNFDSEYKIVFWDNLELEDFIKKLGNLENNDVIFIGGSVVDQYGHLLDLNVLTETINENTSALQYVFWDYQLTPYTLGGFVVNFQKIGIFLGEAVMEYLLNGVMYNKYENEEVSFSEYIFNLKIIEQIGINQSQLPKPYKKYSSRNNFINDVNLLYSLIIFLLLIIIVLLIARTIEPFYVAIEKTVSLNNGAYIFLDRAKRVIRSDFSDKYFDFLSGVFAGSMFSEDNFPKDFVESINRIINKKEMDKTVNFEYKNDKVFYLGRVTSYFNNKNKPEYFIALERNDTINKFTDDLINFKEDLNILFEIFSGPALKIDKTFYIRKANKAFRKLVDLPEVEITGKHVSYFIDSVDNSPVNDNFLKKSKNRDVKFISGNFIERTVIDFVPVCGSYFMLFGKITESSLKQMSFKKKNRFFSFSLLMSKISDNIENIVSDISELKAIEEEIENKEAVVKLLKIKRSIKKELDSFKNTGVFNEKAIIKQQKLNLSRSIKRITSKIEKNNPNCPGFKIISSDEFIIETDRKMFGILICELLKNALQASLENRTEKPINIYIFDETLEKSQELFSRKIGAGKYLKTEIIDYGAGIPEEKLTRIFDPLYSAWKDNKHSGVGLTFVKQILDLLSVSFDVKSCPGETSFALYFPYEKVKKIFKVYRSQKEFISQNKNLNNTK
ncbi:MAG: hypothetical protein CSB55_04620 [Candidatus Cloacimonadota bacterium]|nr:MAG: hypothetical protein CSB55_04620 [Candidatus Cloacimonadota bacterium]